MALFPEGRLDATADEDIRLVRLRLKELSVQRPRQWGACWLALYLWHELQLDQFWSQRLKPSRKGTRWDLVLAVLTVYRLLAPGSEWRLHRGWFESSALADLLGVDFSAADPHKLYGGYDQILAHQNARFSHLMQRWRDLFGAEFDVLLYNLTRTHFESGPRGERAFDETPAVKETLETPESMAGDEAATGGLADEAGRRPPAGP